MALNTAPVLVMPNYAKPFELIADACGWDWRCPFAGGAPCCLPMLEVQPC